MVQDLEALIEGTMSEPARRTALIFHRFSRFLVVGALSTAIQYVILIALVESLSAAPTFASGIGFVVSSIANYHLNYGFTFQSDLPHRVAAPRFVMTAVFGLTLNSAAMFVFAELLSLQYVFAQILATSLTICWNFFANQAWSFSSSRE